MVITVRVPKDSTHLPALIKNASAAEKITGSAWIRRAIERQAEEEERDRQSRAARAMDAGFRAVCAAAGLAGHPPRGHGAAYEGTGRPE